MNFLKRTDIIALRCDKGMGAKGPKKGQKDKILDEFTDFIFIFRLNDYF